MRARATRGAMFAKPRNPDERGRADALLCVLDKAFPPDHAFVRGMLCDAYPRASGVRVYCLVSRGDSPQRVRRFGRSVCLCLLHERRSVHRVANLFISIAVILYLARRLANHRLKVLVRNDPLALVASVVVRKRVARTIFQSSYPHEDTHRHWVIRAVTRTIFRCCIPLTDAVLVVAPAAIERIRRYSSVVPTHVLPLLADGTTSPQAVPPLDMGIACSRLRLLYLGTHATGRQLEVVFGGCWEAMRRGVPLEMVSVGATESEMRRLLAMPFVRQIVEHKCVTILPRRERCQLSGLLEWATIGVSAIPPLPRYREASPTKLAEYLAAGVPVLASRGIPLQEQWVSESGAGLLVDFTEESIADGIEEFWRRRDELGLMRCSAVAFATEQLKYESYIGVLEDALGMDTTGVSRANNIAPQPRAA